MSIAKARGRMDKKVAIVGIVTAPATLLDSSRRLIVVQDASGAIEVRLPDTTAQPVGTRLRVEGKVGRSYGAPRIAADAVKRLGSAAVPAPVLLYGTPKEAHEWRLVTVRGRIDAVRKLGDRWRAELVVGRDRVVLVGQSGAGIPVASVLDRPSRDRDRHRPTAVPVGDGSPVRDPAAEQGATCGSIRAAPRGVARNPRAGAGGTGSEPRARAVHRSGPGRQRASSPRLPDANLADLASLAGRTVRVGGLVGDLLPGGFTLDDGTATGPVVLEGAAADLLPLIEPGDAINVVGRIESTDRGWTVVVDGSCGNRARGRPGRPWFEPRHGREWLRRAHGDAAAAHGDTRSAGLGLDPGS